METSKKDDLTNSSFVLIDHPRTRKFISENNIKQDVTRTELINLGYSMQNQVALAERTIVRRINEVDTSELPLLTFDQLSKHISESLPEGMTVQELPAVEADMKNFILDAIALSKVYRILSEEKVHLLVNFFNAMKSNNLFAKGISGEFGEDKFLESFLYISREAQLETKRQYKIPEKIRGIPIELIKERKEGGDVNGHGCPVLSCGHTFDGNYGVRIYETIEDLEARDPKDVRLNFVVAHLASHGISENGDHVKDFNSQNYASLKWYKKIYDLRNDKEENGPKIDEKSREIEHSLYKNGLRLLLEKCDIAVDQEIVEKIVEDWFTGAYSETDYS